MEKTHSKDALLGETLHPDSNLSPEEYEQRYREANQQPPEFVVIHQGVEFDETSLVYTMMFEHAEEQREIHGEDYDPTVVLPEGFKETLEIYDVSSFEDIGMDVKVYDTGELEGVESPEGFYDELICIRGMTSEGDIIDSGILMQDAVSLEALGEEVLQDRDHHVYSAREQVLEKLV